MVAERRNREPERGSNGLPLVPCRQCWAHVEIDPARVEVTDGRAYYSCQECGAGILIRWEDAVDLGVARPTEAASGDGG